MTDLIDVKEAARLLNIKPPTVRELIKAGKLRACLIGNKHQIKQEWIEEFIERQEVQVQK